LAAWKAQANARAIPVLEDNDIQLTNADLSPTGTRKMRVPIWKHPEHWNVIKVGETKEDDMKKLLIATASAALLAIASVSASAQFYAGADPGGVGVQVGPLGVGVGPRYDRWHDGYRRHGYSAYGYADCRVIRDRTVTPSGRVIITHRRSCD